MQNPFKRFFTSLQPAGDSVIGIDIGSAYIKAVQLRKKGGRAILETYGALALGPYGGLEIGRATHLPVPKLSEALRDLLREAHTTTFHGASAIPFSSSLVTSIEMRVLDEKELQNTVPIEARKYIPVPISEVNLDWWVIPPEPGNIDASGVPESQKTALTAFGGEQTAKKVQILIAAIHNEAMSRFTGVCTGAGVQASFYEIELFSTIRALLGNDREPHALLDLGAGETKLYIIDRGMVKVSHIINHGAQDLTLALSRSLTISVEEAEEKKRSEGVSGDTAKSLTGILNVVFSDVARAIKSFEEKNNRVVSEVVLSGGGAGLKGIEDIATTSFNVPVRPADPFRQVEAPAFLDDVLKRVGPEFSVAVGVAFRKLQEGA
ncbi:MAG: hypothetical protein COV91_05235 [Candidatus Taylorbacteria bacterium CG11_big_fil_rev_8_21_14_0_20_46_11]|uniref:SHS2 domain-containing protein n=1 Tax=Candidatus Taylorbacteria bacterium CG11_big_fil_rev_8_21_14_0_20_46_11 TaxID=1975025 RepID=A0A2H0KAE3_9BACT|nr:MAG: hypothetical protein COV91_05235 [Candidatus Taylorbacteria bacterium CG11_big_fil_rev_8_21_14_0_20_46_11]